MLGVLLLVTKLIVGLRKAFALLSIQVGFVSDDIKLREKPEIKDNNVN